uniref:Uncharacterized protein n=1 Tax=Felis catus TaxID=9685 RepID=A0ABI7YZ45_FELCA
MVRTGQVKWLLPGTTVIPSHAFKVTEWEMWSSNDGQMSAVSLKDYIAVKQNVPKYLSRTWRPAVESLTNPMMLHSHNNSKQLMTLPVAKCTLEIIYLLTGGKPHITPLTAQVLVHVIIHRFWEDSTRTGRTRTGKHQATDVSPLRRGNQGSSNSYAIKKHELESVLRSNHWSPGCGPDKPNCPPQSGWKQNLVSVLREIPEVILNFCK